MEEEKKSWQSSLKSNLNLTAVGSVFRDLVDGNILVRQSFRKQYILLLIIAGMCILYIGNRYTCDYNIRRQRELIKEIDDRRYELLSISAELTQNSRGSVIEDSVKAHVPELEVSRVPSIIIEEEK